MTAHGFSLVKKAELGEFLLQLDARHKISITGTIFFI